MDRKLNRRIYLDQEQEIVAVAFRATPVVLMSESAEEYLALHKKLIDEIHPRGLIEAVYVEEIADLVWDIQRLRKFKITIIILATRRSLVNILMELLTHHGKIKVDTLAKNWFSEDEDEAAAAKEEVRKILQRSNLDESVIEAEAVKLVADQLDWLDKNLAAASSRLEKSLRFVKSYRADFENDLRHHSNRLLNLPAARQAT
jgi:chorismate-pyruvate lyase